MAYDLAHTPVTGIQVQACGDCHLLNFGLFATPERNVIFDINDFDETLQAPWEWDLKRLTTSFVVAARSNGISDQRGRDAAVTCGRSYRRHMHEFSDLSPLDVWYYRVSAEDLIDVALDAKERSRREKMAAKAQTRVGRELVSEDHRGRGWPASLHRTATRHDTRYGRESAGVGERRNSKLPCLFARRTPRLVRPIPFGRFRIESRRDWQRWHALLRRVVVLRRQESALVAGEGGSAIRPRALRG